MSDAIAPIIADLMEQHERLVQLDDAWLDTRALATSAQRKLDDREADLLLDPIGNGMPVANATTGKPLTVPERDAWIRQQTAELRLEADEYSEDETSARLAADRSRKLISTLRAILTAYSTSSI